MPDEVLSSLRPSVERSVRLRRPIPLPIDQLGLATEYHPRVIFFVIMAVIAIGAVIVLIRMK